MFRYTVDVLSLEEIAQNKTLLGLAASYELESCHRFREMEEMAYALVAFLSNEKDAVKPSAAVAISCKIEQVAKSSRAHAEARLQKLMEAAAKARSGKPGPIFPSVHPAL